MLKLLVGYIHNGFYELYIEVEPERSQHLGVYTSRELPFRLTVKTSSRNTGKLHKLLDNLPRPSLFGGYKNRVSYERRFG